MKGKIIYNPILQNMLNPLVLETYVEGNRTLKDSIKIPEVIGIQSIEYIRTNPSGDNVYSIKLTNGLSYEIIAPKGDDGVGVLSVKFTRTESNGDKVYTIKLSNGNSFEFVCPKGSPGTTNYNELENKPFIPTKVSELQNDSGYATSQQVQQQITNLINAAPQTLDTLKELADALGNDPNFSVTITNQLSNKADKNDLKPILLEAFEDFDIEAVSNQLNNGGRVVLVENDGGNIELSTYITSSQTNRVLYMQFTSISGITFDPYNIIDYVHYKWTLSSGWNMYEYEIPLTNKYDPVEFNLVRTQNNGVVTYNFGNAKFSKLKEAIDDGKIVHILLDNYCFKLDYQVDSQSYIFSSLIQDYGNNGVGVMEVYEGENDSIEASLEQNIFNYKQDTLVSGTNIKTINNQSLLGSGNLDISGGVFFDMTSQTIGNTATRTYNFTWSDLTTAIQKEEIVKLDCRDLDNDLNFFYEYSYSNQLELSFIGQVNDKYYVLTLRGDSNDQIVESAFFERRIQSRLTFDSYPTQRSNNPVTSDGIYTALQDIADSIPAGQVNADWNASSGVAQILNKPLFTRQAEGAYYIIDNHYGLISENDTNHLYRTVMSADSFNIYDDAKTGSFNANRLLLEDDDSGLGVYITTNTSTFNKVSASELTIQGATSDDILLGDGTTTSLSNITTSISAAQIQSDWNQTTTTAKDYIKNKPTLTTVTFRQW